MEKGFLYVANIQKFIDEAIISVKSLRRFNSEPVCLICTPDIFEESLNTIFDKVIILPELKKKLYLAKIIGLQHTPFQQTIFLDGDTFITDTISEVFDVLDIADFATTVEPAIHTSDRKDLRYRGYFPEFNTGFIAYRNNDIMQKIFVDWLAYCDGISLRADMPGLREAVLMNFRDVHFSVLPDCYNEHGFKTMLVLYNKVKVIHERLSYKRGYYTPHFGSFEKMDRFAQKINKIENKRLYIPKIGVISYRWSPENIILQLKKRMGFKRASKNK